MQTNKVRVWDPFVRVFHWMLVLAFAVSYLTEDDYTNVHVYSGYLILGLVSLRLLWGLVGGRYARFRSFIRTPSDTVAYLKDAAQFRAKRYIGHNPAGGAMIMALLASLGMTLLFGLLTYGATEYSGPLAGMVAGVGDRMAHGFKEVHEFFANFTLALVLLHVAGVFVASVQHGENLVRSMITGTKEIQSTEDLEVRS